MDVHTATPRPEIVPPHPTIMHLWIAPSDVEPDQLHDAGRPRVDVQHTPFGVWRIRIATIQHNRACQRRLDDDAPGDAELAAEEVRAGSKDHVANSCVGECTGQVGDGVHRRDPRR